MLGSRSARSPITRTRTLLACSSARSLRMKRRSRPIRSRTSDGGRCQFSDENENSVRQAIPISPAARTVLRNASTPRRCPSTRGSPRAAAQRPFPSMMMATCRGTSGTPPATSVCAISVPSTLMPSILGACAMMSTGPAPSHRHDLFFLAGERAVDIGDGLIGRLLHQLGLALVLVLAHRLEVFFQLLEHVHRVAADMADRNARGLGIFVRDLHEFLAALLVEL